MKPKSEENFLKTHNLNSLLDRIFVKIYSVVG